MADWNGWHQADLREYDSNRWWAENGICPNVEPGGSTVDRNYPWKCGFCYQLKRFCCLEAAEAHLQHPKHKNRSWETHGDQPPELTQRPPRREATQTRAPSIGSAPPPPDPSRGPSPASVPQDPPWTSMTRGESCSLLLRNATVNGVPIDCATLTVNLTNGTAPPPFTCLEIFGAAISCELLPARSSATSGPPPFPLPPGVGADDPVLFRSMVPSVPASAASGTPAPGSLPGPARCFPLPGMTCVFAKPPLPQTLPKPPPPVPSLHRAPAFAPPATRVPSPARWGATADASPQGAASERAGAWQ